MTLYDDLGVSPDADEATLKRARNKRVRETHPDAGGDAAAFDRAQRAYVVLSDPARREEYDRTGRTEFKDPETEESADAMNLLAGAFSQVLGAGVDLRHLHVVKQVQRLLREAIGNIDAKIAECGRGAARLADLKSRLTCKEGHEDRLTPIVDGQIGGVNQAIAQYERAKRVHERALAMTEGYEDRVDPPPKAPAWDDLRRPSFFGPVDL